MKTYNYILASGVNESHLYDLEVINSYSDALNRFDEISGSVGCAYLYKVTYSKSSKETGLIADEKVEYKRCKYSTPNNSGLIMKVANGEKM